MIARPDRKMTDDPVGWHEMIIDRKQRVCVHEAGKVVTTSEIRLSILSFHQIRDQINHFIISSHNLLRVILYSVFI
jgi:hypothetical protein